MPAAQTVSTIPAKVGTTGITTQHQRLAATAAATIGSLCSGARVPQYPGPNLGEIVYPQSVSLQVEAAGGAVYYTIDGSTPSATNGMQLPNAPGQIYLPYPTHLRNSGTVSASNQQIQLFAPVATNVQALFEFV